jgi:hypothetical protein
MMTPQHIRRALRSALIYSFELRGFEHRVAVDIADIAMETCLPTVMLCEKLVTEWEKVNGKSLAALEDMEKSNE